MIASIALILAGTFTIKIYKGYWRPFSYSREWKNEGIVLKAKDYCNYMANPEIAELPNGTWIMYTHGWPRDNTSKNDIYAFSSPDGLNWKSAGMVIENASMPAAVKLPDGKIRLYFVRNTSEANGVMSALSSDGLAFRVEEGHRFAIGGGAPKDIENFAPYYKVTNESGAQKIKHMAHLNIVELKGGGYRIYFGEGGMKAQLGNGKPWDIARIRSISSEDGLNWKLDPGVRIDVGEPPLQEMQRADSPSVVRIGDEYHMFFNASFGVWEDIKPWKRWSWSGVYEAVSKNGLDFKIIDKRLVYGSDAAIIKTNEQLRMYTSVAWGQDVSGINCINIESWVKKLTK